MSENNLATSRALLHEVPKHIAPKHIAAKHIAATRTLLATPRKRAYQWVWPLPTIDGVSPSALARVGPSNQLAIQIGYRDLRTPKGVIPIFAVRDGVITYASRAKGSSVLCMDHPGGWQTQYESFERLTVLQTDRFHRCRNKRVQAGDVLGYVQPSSTGVRFAMSQLTEGGLTVVDPDPWMQTWTMLDWSGSVPRGCGPRAA